LRIVLRGRLRANAARSRAGTRPLEYFTKWDEFGGVQISPDGEFIAALTGKYGRSMLVFQDLKNKKTVATVGRRWSGWHSATKVTPPMTRALAARCTSGSCNSSTRTS
jgi:hypothetical protein